MADTPGMPIPADRQARSAVEGATAFMHVFGTMRPILRTEELPTDALDGVPGRTRLLVQLLHNRGILGADAIATFLAGDWRARSPALLHLDRAIERIQRAIDSGERIVVFGDFDCDGITSCALLTIALRVFGANVTPYVPRRDDDGRGLNLDAVRELANGGAKLIITTDCGVANVAEVELARALDVDVIVTDHHPPHGPLAPAHAIINPQQDGDESGEGDLSGVGVAFRLAEVLLAALPTGEAVLPQLLALVAVGTIADVVPMSPSNWSLVRAGLHQINTAPQAGIRALLALARLQPSDVSARDISFAIAPRINACGRMGRPDLAMALMLAVDASEADELAREVETLNTQRQAITDTIVAEAHEQAATQIAAGANVVVTQGDRWPLGVLGLVAGRLSEEYRRPAFVISRDGLECRGSARSPVGVDLGLMLAARSELFTRFGGHARAAGFTIPTQTLTALLAYLEQYFSVQVAVGAEIEGDGRGLPPVIVDCRLPLRRLEPGSTVYNDLETLEPFGPGFTEPVFLCPDARILGCRRSGVEGRTLRLRLAYGGVTREFIWSRRGEICDTVRSALNGLPPVDVAFTLRKYHRSATGAADWLPHIETLAPAESSAS